MSKTKYRILNDGKTVINWDVEYYDILNDEFENFCKKNKDNFKFLKKYVNEKKIAIASRYSSSPMYVTPIQRQAYSMMLEEFKVRYKKGFLENIHNYIRRISIEDIEVFVSFWGNNLIGLKIEETNEEFMPTTVTAEEFQNFFDNLPDFNS